jgi:hypothetical protein
MPTWNVVALVVDLVDADTAEDAQRQLEAAVRTAGFDTFTPTDPTTVNVAPFESDLEA